MKEDQDKYPIKGSIDELLRAVVCKCNDVQGMHILHVQIVVAHKGHFRTVGRKRRKHEFGLPGVGSAKLLQRVRSQV